MDNTTKQSRTGGRSYMMRSEKRPGFDGRPPRKKTPRHRLYKALTMLLLLVCYPVGLVLLWRKPSAGTALGSCSSPSCR